jgi:hypothetical protein
MALPSFSIRKYDGFCGVPIDLSSCQGGATRLFGLDGKPIAFKPIVGAILLHVHGDLCLEHCGDPVISGTKWVLRTDLVYRRKQ